MKKAFKTLGRILAGILILALLLVIALAVIPLTERYRDRLFLFGPGQPRRLELRYTGEGLGLVGIPKSENKGEGTDHGEQ